LARKGRKKIARFRIVAADSRKPRDGRFIETLGYYNPQAEPKEFKINITRIGYWLKNGAQVSGTVTNLLKQDNFTEQLEAIEKGLGTENLDIKRKPERKRKPKPKAKAGKPKETQEKKPKETQEEKPEETPVEKPEEKTEDKPEDKPEEKPEEKAEEKTEEKTEE
jgi:small subunit ribosomal protein S16